MKRRLAKLEKAARAQRPAGEPVRSNWLSRLAGEDVYLPAGATWFDAVQQVCDEHLDRLIAGDDLGCDEDYPPGPVRFPHLSDAELDAIITGETGSGRRGGYL